MIKVFKVFRYCIAAAIINAIAHFPAMAREGNQAALQAAIIYNVIRFTDLGSSDQNVVLCVPSDNHVAKALYAYNGKSVFSGRLLIKEMQNPMSLSNCRAAYIGQLSEKNANINAGRGILLIGEGSDFLDNGGSIALVRFGRQIGFEINIKASNQAGVRYSSRLLRLARNVKG